MSCLIMTPQIKEIAKNLNMNPEECKDWIGYWQEQTGANLEAYPTTGVLNSFIKESMKDSFFVEEEVSNYERGEQGPAESIFGNESQRTITGENISSSANNPILERGIEIPKVNITRTGKVIKHKGNWLRSEAFENKGALYVFTDNTNRSSGRHAVGRASKYYQKHNPEKKGELYFPGRTTAVVRGLDNAVPITTQKYYDPDKGLVGEKGRWNDEDFEEFKKVIDDDIAAIEAEWNNGNYTEMIFPSGDGLFNAPISGITLERTPLLYHYLYQRVADLVNAISGTPLVSSTVEENTEATGTQTAKESAQTVADILSSGDVVPTAALEKMNTLFSPQVRRDRVSLISRWFSVQLSKATEELQKRLGERITNSDESAEVKAKLQKERDSITRLTALQELRPSKIFERVQSKFQEYLDHTDEWRIAVEMVGLRNSTLSEEEKLKEAERRAKYKAAEFQKIVGDPQVFKALCQEACKTISINEGIDISTDYSSIRASDVANNDIDEENTAKDENDPLVKEEEVREGWMMNFRNISSKASLSQKVRKALATIPRLGYDGQYEHDDLGYQRYLDSSYAHATIIDALKNMTSPGQMIPILQKLSKSKPWVSQVIKRLDSSLAKNAQDKRERERLYTEFYTNFRKDFINYSVTKLLRTRGGNLQLRTIFINNPEGTWYLLDEWRDNFQSGSPLTKDSIYDTTGAINKDMVSKNLEKLLPLQKIFANKRLSEIPDLLEEKDENGITNYDKIKELLNAVGISITDDILTVALTEEGSTTRNPTNTILQELNYILKGIKDGKLTLQETENEEIVDNEEEVRESSPLEVFKTAYNIIAEIVSNVTEDATESSVMENGKSYYSHNPSNYLGKLIKLLKNSANDPREIFEQFINESYGQFEWFKKNGRWLNHWLELIDTTGKTGIELKEAEELREGLRHKITLNMNKQSYSKLDAIDYLSLLISDYFSEPEGKAGEHHWAWYPIPVLSDKDSAEAIRFLKYVTEYDPILGREVTYEEKILDVLKDVVLQEYNRIQLVRKRNADPNIHKIGSYDKRGLEFCFFPALNTYYDYAGRPFLATLESMMEENSDTSSLEAENYIKEALSQIMDDGFEEDFAYMTDIGLLRENNDKYRYLSFQFKRTQERDYRDLVGEKGALTYAKYALDGIGLWEEEMETLYQDLKGCKAFSTRWANDVLEQVKNALNTSRNMGKITDQGASELQEKLVFRNYTKEGLREYYWNSKLAASQIIELTTTDLAFYENGETFQKRFAEIHSPSTKLNTLAEYNGERVGKDIETTIYVKDEEIISEMVDTCKEWVEEKLINGELSNFDAANILAILGYSNYKVEQKDKEGNVTKIKEYVRYGTGEEMVMVPTSKVNVADGQAYRILDSYRCVAIMGGAEWGDAQEEAYQRLKRGKFSIEDINVVFQPLKPFVYTQVSKKSGIQNVQGEDINIKVPIQHKNSEFLLLTLYGIASADLGKSSKLKALDRFMRDCHIDVVQFESAVKVGKQGVISLEGAEDEQAVYNRLKEVTKANTVEEDPDIVQSIPYSDYGIQQNVPEHLMENTVQLVGTQLRKLIAADISDNTIIDVDGRSLTKKEWLDLYNAINTENIIESFTQLSKRFENPKAIEELLQEEIRTNPRYGNDLQKACTLDENGNFMIPLYDPIQCNRVQELLNSIIRNTVTKQKIRGGSAVQVSCFGFSGGLHILYERNENGEICTKGWECLLPATSRAFFEPFMDADGKLNIEKMPESLRKAIGYRIPTEDKYSMVPIYIVGFLPQSSGAAVMLPAEITAIANSDFDVDKLYLMLKTFRKVYNIEQAWEEFYNLPENKDIVAEIERNKNISKFLQEQIIPLANDPEKFTENLNLGRERRNYEFSEEAQERFSKWFNEHKEYYDTGRIEAIEYDHKSAPKDNSRSARNNLLIDMIWGVLTNSDTLSKLYNPGGFDKIKKVSRIIRFLESGKTEKELMDILKTVDFENVQEVLNKTGDPIEALSLLDIDTLTALTESFIPQLDTLSPSTQVKLQQRNMIGANLIGIYANQNVNHALFQHTDASIVSDNPITINNKSYTSLHEIYNPDDERISKNNAEFVGASVDNAKDPVLIDLNQNTFTANMSSLLIRLGYSIQEVGLFMKQPAIVEITQNYLRLHREGISIQSIVEDCLSKYNEALKDIKLEEIFTKGTTLQKILSLAQSYLAKCIILNSSKDSESSYYNEEDFIIFNAVQRVVIETFQSLLDRSGVIESGIRAMRGDTSNGGSGPTFGDTRSKISNVEQFEDNLSKDLVQVSTSLVKSGLYKEGMSIDQLREQLLKSPLPYVQAFYTLGVEASQRLLGPYFPQLSIAFNTIISKMEGMAKYKRLDVKTINNIYNEIFAYYLSGEEFFGEQTINGNTYSNYQKRNVFINQFPEEFVKIKSTHPEIAQIPLVRQIHRVKANKNRPVPALLFNHVGSLDAIQKENYMNDWNALLYMKNPDGTPNTVARNLAINLFRYSYYRNGFAFGSNTFMHLSTVELKLAIPGYVDALRKLTVNACSSETLPGFDEFIDQYIYNHLDNRRLVPEVSEKSTLKFFETDPKTGKNIGNIKDTVSLTITESSTIADKSIVQDTETNLDGTNYIFFNYICKSVDGKDYYYKLNTAETTSDTAVYDRIDPLGWRHNFLEYEFGVPVEQIKSAIAKNDRNYVPPKTKEEQQFEGEMGTIQDYNYNGPEVDSKDMTLEELEDIMDESSWSNIVPMGEISNYQRSQIGEAYESMFGEELDFDNLTQPEAFDNIEDENFECLDADGLPLCK